MYSLPRHHPPKLRGCPRPTLATAFSLIELLVVISVLAILLALLLPALGSAKNAARTTQCAANLRGLGQALACYTGENGDVFPIAYTQKNVSFSPSGQTPAVPDAGIVHWSDVLCSSGYSQPRSLMCPSFDRGGLPPANSSADNLEPNQIPWTPGIVDQQVSRCAYTVNQALCPTNRLALGYQGAITASRAVKTSSVLQPAATILATEWTHSWSMVHRR
jgi:prepilin-type N-terminal cleavage/methylation domain-containing protein